MCTMISIQQKISGSGKAGSGWFHLSQANVGYDHATHAPVEHALLLDFVNPEMGPGARIAVELDLASSKALVEQIQAAIAEAEKAGVAE